MRNDKTRHEGKVMQRLDWSLSRKVTQDIKTQPQINHYQLPLTVFHCLGSSFVCSVRHFT